MSAAGWRWQDFTPPGKTGDLDCQSGFLGHFAMQSGVKAFAEFNPPAGKRIKTLGR